MKVMHIINKKTKKDRFKFDIFETNTCKHELHKKKKKE